jgi:hypothetical protein
VALERTQVSDEPSTSFIRVISICELGTMLASVTSYTNHVFYGIVIIGYICHIPFIAKLDGTHMYKPIAKRTSVASYS